MAKDDLERRFGDAVAQLGFELVANSLYGPPALEDLLADIDVDADAPIRALTSLCGTGDGDALALTRSLLDVGVDPEDAAWAARLWAETRDGPAISSSEEPLTDPEPVLGARHGKSAYRIRGFRHRPGCALGNRGALVHRYRRINETVGRRRTGDARCAAAPRRAAAEAHQGPPRSRLHYVRRRVLCRLHAGD